VPQPLTDRLQLVVDDQALLDDLNPYAADGWWSAVDGMQGRCVVVIVREGDVNLAHHEAGDHHEVGDQLAALMGTGRAVSTGRYRWPPSCAVQRRLKGQDLSAGERTGCRAGP
jgi:hypothetical protein